MFCIGVNSCDSYKLIFKCHFFNFLRDVNIHQQYNATLANKYKLLHIAKLLPENLEFQVSTDVS